MRRAFLCASASALLALLGCGGKQNAFCDNGTCDDGGAGDATTDGTTGDENQFIPTEGGQEAGPCGIQCSSDLHQVLDCNNNVIKTCPADQGCAPDGSCVPACDAAKANKSSVGCDYYAMNPVFFSGGSCLAAFIANTWGSPVKVSVDRGGTSYNVASFGFLSTGNGQSITYTPLANGTIPAGQVGLLMLNKDGGLGCPNNLPTATTGASFTGTGTGQAFHIATDAPVVAYDIYPFGGGSTAVASGTLLLPTSVWSDNYVGITAYPQGFGAGGWMAVVAQEDNTDFTIVAPAAIAGGGGVAAAAANTPTTYHLPTKGSIIKFEQSPDLSGAPIQSTKPVGMWAGNPCTNLEQPACDGMHQQIPPVKALGSEYAAVRYRNRLQSYDEKPPWRIMGVVDGTTLTYDPAIAQGPTTLSRGQVVEFQEGGPFTVKSQDAQHPFYFGAHMTGCFSLPGNYGSPIGCAGDPEFVNVVPPAQYLGNYVFFTDPTYPETHLVFVRGKAQDNTFKDVNLDCAGNLTGWKPVGAGGKYEYTRLDLVTGNFQKVGNCDNGRHAAKSDGPFGLTVWGWGSSATKPGFFSEACSYAYAAGMSVQPINTVVVPPTPK